MLTHRPTPAESRDPKSQTVFIENTGEPLPKHAPAITSTPTLTAQPLTVEAFKPYGDVIQAFPSPDAAPKDVEITAGNGGSAYKYNWLAKIEEIYPQGRLVRGGLSIGVMRQDAHYDISAGAQITVTTLERHACTTQAFVPMGKTAPVGKDQLPAGGAMVVVVALNGKDDKPDIRTMKAFLVTGSQGVSYHAGIWHHGMLTVDAKSDYIVVEAQIGDGDDILDLEKYTPPSPYCTITVPAYTGRNLTLSEPTTSYKSTASADPSLTAPAPAHAPAPPSSDARITHPQPLTPAAFAPYGRVIQTYPTSGSGAHERTPEMEVHLNPAGKAAKYTRLAPIVSTYPESTGAKTAISVMRCTPREGLRRGKVFDVRNMERHPFTSQAFIPMGKAPTMSGDAALPPGGAFLVVVADNGPDDRPDPATLKSFVMESNMGMSYSPGVWHHPTIVMDETMDLAFIDTQITTGALGPVDPRDLELLTWSGDEVFGRIMIPSL